MQAIVYTKYGSLDVLRLEEIPRPVPRDDEVLVEVHASSVNYGNLVLVAGEPFISRMWSGLLKPKDKVPGGDIAGRVVAFGRNVKEFQPGDEVFGDSSSCGFGAYAEYVSVPVNTLAPKPANISFEEAAAVPQAALVALQGLRDKGKTKAGQKVLINGASGGNGTFAVQIAKAFGAEVTGVCSTKNLELVRSIGADHIIDYTQQDFAQSGQLYDLIFATAGDRSIFDYKRALSPTGIYVMAGGSMKQIMQATLLGSIISKSGGKKLCNLYHRPDRNDLIFMKELIEAGKVKPVIDRHYPLSEVGEALRYYEKGHARGKVVITIDHDRNA
ncbi:NAD(P)-dependent alcohol dehydrogenase [candidate division KSB1 bacterium]|nr:NAD(P)-dependent alcohol dehydrogenase [candidate division KSB1 bacterium]